MIVCCQMHRQIHRMHALEFQKLGKDNLHWIRGHLWGTCQAFRGGAGPIKKIERPVPSGALSEHRVQ
jgi:hypothetical protein